MPRVVARGLSGWHASLDAVLARWLDDVSATQAHKFASSLAPVRAAAEACFDLDVPLEFSCPADAAYDALVAEAPAFCPPPPTAPPSRKRALFADEDDVEEGLRTRDAIFALSH